MVILELTRPYLCPALLCTKCLKHASSESAGGVSQNLLSYEKGPNQNLACFVHHLKIINTYLTNDEGMLKQIA